MYREIKWQQVLKEYKISGIFSRTNQDRSTMFAFLLSCLINLLYLIFYEAPLRHRNGETNMDAVIQMPANVQAVVNVLNVIQAIAAGFTLLLFMFTVIPVKYQSLQEDPYLYDKTTAVLMSCADTMAIYYCVYLCICIFGVVFSDYWMPFLLLDIIVKNQVCANVLKSVINPISQLGTTLLLGLFVTYIYAYIYFTYFLDELSTTNDKPVPETLFTFVLMSWSMGLRAGGGFGDWFEHSLSPRWILDLSYFLIVNVILLNIIFGIIIDTFSDLRSKKEEKNEDIIGRCFSCGILKEKFDRELGPDGFTVHIKR